jgi:hypothetical protein
MTKIIKFVDYQRPKGKEKFIHLKTLIPIKESLIEVENMIEKHLNQQ